VTTGTTPVRAIEVDRADTVPMSRLFAVELRKTFDTRAGRWFTISILGLCVITMLIAALLFPTDTHDFRTMLRAVGGVVGYFLPIVLILLVTSEWSQRTGLVTFTLEPNRSRIVIAKFAAGVVLAIVVLAIGAAVAAVGVLLGSTRGSTPEWNVGFAEVWNFALGNLIGVFVGFALGMLLMNSAAAIVLYFVYTFIVPTAFGIVGFYVDWFETLTPWIEFNTAQVPLFDGDYRASGEEWAQIATSGTIWLLIPLAVGIWRLLRAEVK
jgi:ABC-2 type transport system permease protein